MAAIRSATVRVAFGEQVTMYRSLVADDRVKSGKNRAFSGSGSFFLPGVLPHLLQRIFRYLDKRAAADGTTPGLAPAHLFVFSFAAWAVIHGYSCWIAGSIRSVSRCSSRRPLFVLCTQSFCDADNGALIIKEPCTTFPDARDFHQQSLSIDSRSKFQGATFL